MTKYILITGCSNNGIGSALAHSFASHPNLHIFATSRKISSMSSLSSYPNITLLELDVTSPSSIGNALSVVSNSTSGKLDYLLNYAGHGYTIPFIDTNVDIAQEMFNVNVWGAMRVTQAFAPLVIEAKGAIVMAGSTAELLGVPFQAAYSGSKAALQVMTDALRIEMQPFGVRVLHVTTGNVKTNWFSNVPRFQLPENSIYVPIEHQIHLRASGKHSVKWGPADDYASEVVNDVLGVKKGRVYRGTTAGLIRWVVTWAPQWLLDRELKKDTGLETLGK